MKWPSWWITGLESPHGRLFLDIGKTGFVDLSAVRLLRCGVDTVRQLYKGLLRPEILGLFDKPGAIVDFAGERWHSGRVSRDSGYQYKLQNADLGFVLLVKNFNAKVENIGPHLKIEVSPHTIDNLSPERLQARLRVGARKAFYTLKEWDCWPVIRDHYASKGLDEDRLYKHLKALLEERSVRWGRAV